MISPSRVVTKARKPAIGRKGEKGRFVTLKSGQVIFLPEGRRTKWADVKERVKAAGFGRGKVVSSEPLAKEKRGKNAATMVEFEDGTSGIFKTSEITGSTEAEVMAYEFSKSIGWDVVPDTTKFEHGGESGSLQRWIPNSKPIQDLSEEDRIKADANARMRTLDFALQSWDRHQGNIVQDAQGKQWAVDNGGAFRVRREVGPGQAPVAYEDITNVGKEAFFEGRNYSSAPRSSEAKGALRTACGEIGAWRGTDAYDGYLSKVGNTWGQETADLFDKNMKTIAGWGD